MGLDEGQESDMELSVVLPSSWPAPATLSNPHSSALPASSPPLATAELFGVTLVLFVLGLLGGLVALGRLPKSFHVPLRWICNPGDALYWASWLRLVPGLTSSAGSLSRIALQVLADESASCLIKVKELCPPMPLAQMRSDEKDSLYREGLKMCSAGVARLEGIWCEGLLNAEIIRVLESFHLLAARLRFALGEVEHARKHYAYAKAVAGEDCNVSQAASQDCLPAEGFCKVCKPATQAPDQDNFKCCPSHYDLFLQEADSPGEGQPGYVDDELSLLRGITACELLNAGECSPPLRKKMETDLVRLLLLSKRDQGAKTFLEQYSS
eukprot:gnl/MRDRNA2_/MRDRNA2_169854_c0_seq1.p1 gnl/MRDRNA2_/MRDRNA2_169854_c0~~gnl/MRDRNA2_/MRDRNA2_169854_c0_seq1.p1  ORF type:complete len:325 (+),score=46.61 gnl/MRDRNA2_/MRDRNA2_169854_c0_seq1:126-1100(+)